VAEYRPTKVVWFWTTLACVVATMIIGFTWGGWVTGGAAEQRATDAAENARAKLAAEICAYRFLAAPDAGAKLAALKDESSYQRDDMIVKGGWVTLAGAEDPVDGAGKLCAEHLAEAELPAAAAPMQQAAAE
jgi:hypothetical protein